MTPARFRWGMLFILFGVLLLLTRMDVIEVDFWLAFLGFLPILLIAIGIEKIFTKSRLQFISYATSVLLFVGAIWFALTDFQYTSTGGFLETKVIRTEADPLVNQVNAVLELNNGGITVRDATDDLLYGRFKKFTQKPDYKYEVDNNEANVWLTSGHSKWFDHGFIHIETDDEDDWRLSFSNRIPLNLKCYGNQSDIHLNLATTPLRELFLDADDADIYLKIGDLVPNVKIVVAGSDSKFRLRVPYQIGLKVSGVHDEGYFREIGLERKDDFFINDGYDTLPGKIDVDLEDRFRSLSIDYY